MKKLFSYVLKYWPKYVLPVTCMILAIGINMLTPHITGEFIDKVIGEGQYDLSTKLLASLVVIALLRSTFMYIKGFQFDKVSSLITRDLKIDIFDHIQSLPYSFFDKKNTGELMSRIDSDVGRIWETIGFGLALFAENMIFLVLATCCLFTISWKLTLITLLPLPFLALTALKLEKTINGTFGKISDNNSKMNTIAQENIAGVRLVKAFAREKHELSKFFKFNKKNYDLSIEKFNIFGKAFPQFNFYSNLSILAVLVLGGIFVINGSITIGELIKFNLYTWMIIWPIRMLGWLSNMVAQCNASSKKIFKIMDVKADIFSKPAALKLDSLTKEISFKDVSFKYSDEDEYVLKNINLTIPQGSTVAVMGATGSGKSSLINLIGRYYDVTSGCITLDGINVKDLDVKSLRSKLSIVPQDVFLFSESIKENINFANRDASFDDIKAACRKACAEEFISSLDEGYDTVIGERGIGLSGGQKQRLSIARALVKNSDILVLDDSTSALDMETEFQLLKNIYSYCEDMTTIIVAHRISAVKNADMIIVMDDGQIVECGNHASLVAKRGHYYDIYKEQFKDLGICEEEVV